MIGNVSVSQGEHRQNLHLKKKSAFAQLSAPTFHPRRVDLAAGDELERLTRKGFNRDVDAV